MQTYQFLWHNVSHSRQIICCLHTTHIGGQLNAPRQIWLARMRKANDFKSYLTAQKMDYVPSRLPTKQKVSKLNMTQTTKWVTAKKTDRRSFVV